MSGSLLSTINKYFAPEEALDLPAIVVQVISGVGSYIVWAGTTNYTPMGGAEATDIAAEALVQQGRLGSDWACSMASVKPSIPVSGTILLRTSRDPLSLSLSQRLAQRFKKQIFVSVDLNAGHVSGGRGPAVSLAVEKAIMRVLVSLEKGT